MRKMLVGVLALGASLAFSIALYPLLPERVPIHWNGSFQPDDYGPRIVALIFPLAAFVLLPLVARILPAIDPRRNYQTFTGTYWFVLNVIMVFIAALEVFVIGAGLGWMVHMSVLLPLIIGGLFLVLGNVLGRVRPNWFIGIRTPWTLSSNEVWRKTHRVGGRAMFGAGVILVASAALPDGWAKTVPFFAAIVIAAVVPLVYSYVEWRRLGRPEHP